MWLGLAVLLLIQSPADDAPPGRRIDLGGATLFVPAGYSADGGRVDVVLHLHGAERVVERAFAAAGWRAVLIVFNRKGLSSVYEGPFTDPELLPTLLEQARAALRHEGIVPESKPGRLLVSSFSAGFGGVRAMLCEPVNFDRINALAMADSLYAGYAGDPSQKRIDPSKLGMFERFAAGAAAGRKTFVLSHSEQEPDGYASTTETADALIRAAAADATDKGADGPGGWVETRRARAGRFLVIGVRGGGAEDHMRHLRQIERLWTAIPDPFAQADSP